MHTLKCTLYMTAGLAGLQALMYILSVNPEVNWRPFHNLLDWLFAVAFSIPLSFVLPADFGRQNFDSVVAFMIHLPLMLIYGLILSGLICGVRGLVSKRSIQSDES